MTLLVSFYSSSGIVYAADSGITALEVPGAGAIRRPKQDKLQEITQVGISGGVVGYFGLAEVQGQPMDQWLRRKIDQWPGSRKLADFGHYLRDALIVEVPRNVRFSNPSGFHTGCFEERNGIAVPVMHCVTNIGHLDPETGAYSNFHEYDSAENFPWHSDPDISWSRFDELELRTELRKLEARTGLPHWFRNGELAFAGRAWNGLQLAILDITANLDRRFHLPSELRKWEMLADLLVRTNGHLFSMLVAEGDPTIEGPYRTMPIPWP